MMDNDEQLSPIGESSVPVPNRMLRRLKRATSFSDLCPGSKTLGGDLGSANGFDETRSDLDGLGAEGGVTARKVLDFDSVPEFNSSIGDLGEKGDEELSDSEIRVSVTKEAEKEPSVEELGEKGDEEMSDSEIGDEIRVSEAKESGKESVPEFDSEIEELGEKKGEDESSDSETREEIKVWETRKKRSVLETSDNERKERKRSKKRSKKSVDFDELPISSMNMTKKERREHLDQLRAESQRLLRETRDAAFEPVPLVRKPISSVLEKIRRRKEEISKQFLSRKKSKYTDTSDNEDENDVEEVVAEEKNEDTKLKTKSKQNRGGQDSVDDSTGPSENLDIPVNSKAQSSPTHQDPSSPSQTTNSGDELLEKRPGRSLEEVMTPSVLTMNLKLNSSPAPDKSSEDAAHNKENSDPETHSCPGDPVRRFIDEDAEEEDDSDNDLLRFEDEDEDGDEEDDEDLRDMIVSQFKEDPTDKDRRNELHQKWLEQQDAAGTEKLLQKLKRGMQKDEISLSEDEDDDADDKERAEDADDEEVTKPGANEDENEDEDEEDPSNAISLRMQIKKIKEMIPLMFTEEDDAYVSSDDEEIQKKLLQQRLYKKMDQKTKSSSVTGDENSEEVLRYIKKPEIMKKAKPSFKERTLMGLNKNPAASKSSFLGRITKNSTSEGSRKRRSNIVRGYIFERDDSNSKTSNSAPEEPLVPETIIKEKSRSRQAPAKFTASQSQERSATLQAKAVEEETSTRQQRSTLFEILKMSSKKTCFTSGETVISSSSSHTESIFAAFKLDKKPVKTNP